MRDRDLLSAFYMYIPFSPTPFVEKVVYQNIGNFFRNQLSVGSIGLLLGYIFHASMCVFVSTMLFWVNKNK
jgi:hypothetical protein